MWSGIKNLKVTELPHQLDGFLDIENHSEPYLSGKFELPRESMSREIIAGRGELQDEPPTSWHKRSGRDEGLERYSHPASRSPLLYYDDDKRPRIPRHSQLMNAMTAAFGKEAVILALEPGEQLNNLKRKLAPCLSAGVPIALDLVPMGLVTVFDFADRIGLVARAVVQTAVLHREENLAHKAVIEVLKNAFTHGNCFDISWPIIMAYDEATSSVTISDCHVSLVDSPTRDIRQSYLDRAAAFHYSLGGEGMGLRIISADFHLQNTQQQMFYSVNIAAKK